MIDLNPESLETVRHILSEYVPLCEVRAFGSRVKWTAKDYSDLDLAVIRSEQFNPQEMHRLTSAFEESNLPIRVDVVDWHAISEGFKNIIEAEYAVIQHARPLHESAPPKQICGWELKPFGECATLVREPISSSDLGDTPYIGPEHIGENTLSLVGTGIASSVPSTQFRFKQGDILFGTLRCYLRKVVRAPFDGTCSTDIWVTRAKAGVDQNFLYYCMASQAFVGFANAGSEGTLMPRTKWEWVSRHKISLPPLSEQRHIAHLLSTLDRKIELNRQMNETLEATARAIFRAWFVNFDPVKAKVDGRRPPCMDPETAALFPSAFQESLLWKIPHGWKVGTLGEIAKNVRRRVKACEIDASESFIGLEHMPRRTIALFHWKTAAEIGSNTYRFKKGEILFGKLNPHFHKVCVAPIDGVCSTNILVLQPIKAEWFGVVWGIVSSDNFVAYTRAGSKGTILSQADWKDMSNYKIILPDVEIVHKYTEFIHPIIDKIINNIHQSRTLAQIRDTLLPELLSGEIRIGAAAEIVEIAGEGWSGVKD